VKNPWLWLHSLVTFLAWFTFPGWIWQTFFPHSYWHGFIPWWGTWCLSMIFFALAFAGAATVLELARENDRLRRALN
jgi:amino acid transporter